MKKNAGIFKSNFIVGNTLSPTEFWRVFIILFCTSHRQQGRQAVVAEGIINRAGGYDLDFVVDDVGNILVRIPATPALGYLPVRCLHSRIAAPYVSDTSLDGTTPVELLPVENNILKAKGSNFGAVSAVACSAMLMFVTDSAIPHGPLELLFTGLEGINSFDRNQLTAKQVIDLNSTSEGILFIPNDYRFSSLNHLVEKAQIAYDNAFEAGLPDLVSIPGDVEVMKDVEYLSIGATIGDENTINEWVNVQSIRQLIKLLKCLVTMP